MGLTEGQNHEQTEIKDTLRMHTKDQKNVTSVDTILGQCTSKNGGKTKLSNRDVMHILKRERLDVLHMIS